MALHFLGTFESGNTAQFTSASGAANGVTYKEGIYSGKNTDNTNFLKNINTDYGLSDIAHTYAGGWFYWTGSIAGSNWYIMLGDGAASGQWELRTESASRVKIIINGVTYTGTTTISASTWYWILVDFYCHDSAGYAKVYVNGVLNINTGLIDSKTGTDTGVRQIKWQGTNSAGVDCYVDDCLFSETDPDFGIKVSKSGKEVSSIDSKNLDFSTSNFFLKFHDQQDTSVTFNPTDTDKSSTISHSLGYVPAFRAFFDYGGKTYMIPSIPVGTGPTQWAYAHATSTGITVGFKMSEPYNYYSYPIQEYYDTYIADGQQWISGNVSGTGVDGAFRFTNVTIPKNQSIYSASINTRITAHGSNHSDTLFKVWGIDEDNTGSFSSAPMGRSKTTATYSQSASYTSTPYSTGINVQTCLEEIIARGGWSSGNAMGFLTNNNSSPNDSYIATDSGDTKLEVVFNGTLTIPFRVIIFKDKIAT